ncbi:MAG: aspartate kinase [Odoribacteraceae bacterium]|jgi:aspartate kinase|nr:aspartate kinase [Odoribacteraceae bacterium]
MEIFKFGGASVKDAGGVRNLASIVSERGGRLVIVVSAMGKMTNLLEKACEAYFRRDGRVKELFDEFRRFHEAIIDDLFPDARDPARALPREWLSALERLLDEEPSLSYDYEYDRVIPFGELLSTSIVSGYLAANGLDNRLVDIRRYLISDACHRNANVDLDISRERCREAFHFEDTSRYVTQGFIAGTRTSQTTTLGREGSDYTAALLANLLDARSVTIWKDVPGVMSADPKEFAKATVIDRMPYKEAIELSRFGAKVIHPKTIKPLQNKGIPLHVKSFLSPASAGTVIRDFDEWIPLPPVYINKENQLLLTLTPRDFSFIAEEKLSHIFATLARYKLKLNLMQNSAISFSFCIDHHPALLEEFVRELQRDYGVRYNDNVRLVTIRHYTEEMIREVIAGRPVLVEQRSRTTAQFVV